MNPNLIITFESLLDSDSKVTAEQKKAILAACKSAPNKRRFVKRKEALQILDISAPTLLKLIRAGKVDVYRLSARKCRFDLDEIETIANGGSK